MICKNCKNEIINPVRVKNGSICQHCYDSMPESVKININHFTLKQIKQIQELVNEPEEQPIASCGTFKVCRTAIQVNGKEFKIKNLSGVRLNFHPNALGMSLGTAVGTLTVVIDTKFPHYMFEEPFYSKEVTASYRINGKNVTYGYSYAIEKLFACIQKCLNEESNEMTKYINEYQEAVKRNTKEKEEEQRKKTQNRGFSSNQKRQSESSEHQHHTNEDKKEEDKKPKSPFDDAKALFNVELPYTKTDIKRIRNELIKKYHPDLGGSEEMCKKINEAYTLLLKFVS